ncbi:MAG: diacylglycerol kinase family lipid kinase [Chloroflexi bacterium]|nr:diacylglycerol kinase family lipid kinase [Chloroflexota bacterium]
MKAFIVLNPASGKNAREPIREAISRHFTSSQIDYEIHETIKEDKPGDIVHARLSDGFDLVVAAGGDGTVSAVIDGGIIPAGTGNLLARELNVPLGIEDAVAPIAGTHKFRKIDAMRIGKRVYVLNASLGVSASVIGGTTPKNKSRFGRTAYLGTAILKIFALRRRYLVVAVDGKALKYRAVEVAILNSGILTNVLYPKEPDIRIDDGHLDVWIVSLKTLLDYPWYLFERIAGRPAKQLSHFINSEKSVSIRSSVPLPVQADGDIIGMTPVEVEVLPGALTVLVPEKAVPVPDHDLDRNRVMSQYLSGFAQTAVSRKGRNRRQDSGPTRS